MFGATGLISVVFECSTLVLFLSTTMEWARSHNFPTYQQAKMEDTRFLDLRMKVGFPYLYCHQGDCEHLVIITDIRQVTSRLSRCAGVRPPVRPSNETLSRFLVPGNVLLK